ncbi:MAG: pyruvate synthase subunit PorA [Methanobacteriota archaeon]
MKELIEASHAIAEAVKAIRPDVIAAYPITPQTHVVERLSDFVADGELKTEYINVESEFSALSACLGASATGVRSYTATASQGLSLMDEILYIVSGMRLPVCMTIVNRSLSAPINIWNDHQDSMTARDAGWIQVYGETGQEGYDLTLMQFKMSEDHRVLLPSMMCIDGFTLSHVYEPVYTLTDEQVRDFLPDYKPLHAVLDPKDPITQGPIGFPSHFMEFRRTQELAMRESLKVIEEVYNDFNKRFPMEIPDSRPEKYAHLEHYHTEDAEVILVAMGSVCGTIKDVIDEQRNKGVKVGLVKIITHRPFPFEALRAALKNAQKVAIIEKAISPGLGGPVFGEIASALYDEEDRPELRNFIVGLGGRDVKLDHVEKIIEMTKSDKGNKEEWMF